MKLHFDHHYKKKTIFLRNISIIPNLTFNFYENWKIESIRFDWLGFELSFYRTL